ncbi:hypothetical protein [Rhodopila sp.]|uniref:hypothetical protein n=1 Tax=Rhodopila sp. TaxID=2480087 RepID=UPI003D0D7694
MKKLLIAVVAALGVAGPAFAQGLPPGSTERQYGAHAFPNAPYENHTVFSKWFGGHKNSDNNKTVNDTSTSKSTADGS